MSQRVLVAYASACGSTAEVARVIGETIAAGGAAVDVRSVREVVDLSPYGAVVVGSAIRAGKWLPGALRFVKTHREALSRVPVAYFAVCLTLTEDTEENRRTVSAYLDPVRELVEPFDEGLFAGALDYDQLVVPLRLFLRYAKKAPEGDFRQWEAIRAWATAVRSQLSTPESAAAAS